MSTENKKRVQKIPSLHRKFRLNLRLHYASGPRAFLHRSWYASEWKFSAIILFDYKDFFSTQSKITRPKQTSQKKDTLKHKNSCRKFPLNIKWLYCCNHTQCKIHEAILNYGNLSKVSQQLTKCPTYSTGHGSCSISPVL